MVTYLRTLILTAVQNSTGNLIGIIKYYVKCNNEDENEVRNKLI